MKDKNSDSFVETTREKGDSLELAVEHIFKVANFNTERNVFIAKYEIDVKATIGDRTIIIECKNYQQSNLTIRNIIHQWHSKNQLINAHKVIIVLTGLKLKDEDYSLASEFDIELWSEKDLNELFSLSLKPELLRQKLLEKISFKPLTIAERYRDDITYLVIKPLLSNEYLHQENLYSCLNKWVRSHILTELQMVETSIDERANLVELFEGSKIKKGFLNITKRRTEIEYWEIVKEKLITQDILGQERQDLYLSYMNDLIEEVNSQSLFFKGDDFHGQAKKLITYRLMNAIYVGQDSQFTIRSIKNSVYATYLDNNKFEIHVDLIDKNQGNILNWILTSEYDQEIDPETNKSEFYWTCSSFQETSEKIYRIFTEFFNLTSSDSITDLTLVSH